MPELDDYRYRGARALVLLHERHLRIFLERWREARAAGISLPKTDNPHYESLQALLRHPMNSARGYLTWICEKLELPTPDLPQVPPASEIEQRVDRYLEELLRGWREPLRGVAPERFGDRTYTARWGQEYTIGAMLEHAVMHPIRHTFQLEELMAQQGARPASTT